MSYIRKIGTGKCLTLFTMAISANNHLTARQTTTWQKEHGGADKSYDTALLQLWEPMTPRFQTLRFKDSLTVIIITYSLFLPKHYDQNKKYPLVLCMADGSTIIWATDESQASQPCIVLTPAYEGPENIVNNDWHTSDEVELTVCLLQAVVVGYAVDTNRIYATGQLMGGMTAFYLNANPGICLQPLCLWAASGISVCWLPWPVKKLLCGI